MQTEDRRKEGEIREGSELEKRGEGTEIRVQGTGVRDQGSKDQRSRG
jgi:hypothetical protein